MKNLNKACKKYGNCLCLKKIQSIYQKYTLDINLFVILKKLKYEIVNEKQGEIDKKTYYNNK